MNSDSRARCEAIETVNGNRTYCDHVGVKYIIEPKRLACEKHLSSTDWQ